MKNSKKSTALKFFNFLPSLTNNFPHFGRRNKQRDGFWNKRKKVDIAQTDILGTNPPNNPPIKKESNIFLLLCIVVFLFSFGITIHSFFLYYQKIESLNQLVERTDQMEKDSLLIKTLGEEEKKNNLLSLAVDYGYAHAEDLVVYISYPEVVDQSNLTFVEILTFSWRYVFFIGVCILLFFFRKEVHSFYLKYCKILVLDFLSKLNNFLSLFSKGELFKKKLSRRDFSYGFGESAYGNRFNNRDGNKNGRGFSQKVKIISDYIGQVAKKDKNQSWWAGFFDKKEEKAPSPKHYHYLSYSSLHKRKMR